MDAKYLEACAYFPSSVRSRLTAFPEDRQGQVREICLRAERPLVVSAFRENWFAGEDGRFRPQLSASPYLVSKAEVEETVRLLTEYSLHSFRRELGQGFVTVRGGHRAGIAGSFAAAREGVASVTDISSVTLRIARQVKGKAESLCRRLFPDGEVESVLLAGPPASGKTTLLRDLARCLSSGLLGSCRKVSLIDERGELAAVYRGVPQNDVGLMTDVFDGCPKGEGMTMAIRAMTPQVLVVDEIATEREAESVRAGLNAGTAVLATVHAGSLDELHRKRHICSLFAEGAFRHIVLLRGADEPGSVSRVVSGRELVRL